jgi:hypothetical protein
MSAKEAAIELIRHLPNDVSLTGIVAALHEAHQTAEALRRFDERGGIPGEEVTEEEWQALINQSWAHDWSDPPEDIYTLEDGKPSHGSR